MLRHTIFKYFRAQEHNEIHSNILPAMAKQKPVPVSKNKPVQKSTRQQTSASGEGFGKLLLLAAGILLAVFLAYQPALQNDFTNWDDPTYVTENPWLLHPSPESKAALWHEPVSLNYHPLTMQTLAWNMNPAKPEARPFIATNLFLHVCNTLLVFLFAYFLSRKNLLVGAFSALVFGLHPMHVESVAWVSERKDVLYGFFYLAALLVYLRYVRRGGWAWLVLSFGLFVLSCLSKAMAVTLPVVMLLIDFYEGRLVQDRRLNWTAILEKTPFLAASLWFGAMAVKIQAAGAAISDFQVFTIVQRLAFASYGFVLYLYKLFVPYPLCTFYSYPDGALQGHPPGWVYAMPFLALAIVGAAVFALRKSRLWLFGIGFYLVTVALVLQFISVGMVIAADRYTYLPYIGVAFVLGMLLSQGWQRQAWRVPLAVVLGGFTIMMFYLTRQQVQVWKNSETLWSNVLRFYPNTAEAYKNRGNYRGRSGNLEGALQDLIQADALGSRSVGVFTGLGNCYGTKGQFDKAIEAYNKGIQLNPDNGELYYNRGVTYEKMKNYPAALDDFNKALANFPEKAVQITGARGFILMSLGHYDEAIKDFDLVIAKTGGDVNAFQNRGVCKYNLKDRAGALQDLEKAAQFAPQDAKIQQNINIIKSELQR